MNKVHLRHQSFQGCVDGLREIHFHDEWERMDADFFVKAMKAHHEALEENVRKTTDEWRYMFLEKQELERRLAIAERALKVGDEAVRVFSAAEVGCHAGRWQEIAVRAMLAEEEAKGE